MDDECIAPCRSTAHISEALFRPHANIDAADGGKDVRTKGTTRVNAELRRGAGCGFPGWRISECKGQSGDLKFEI
jgi:hypothetical protein